MWCDSKGGHPRREVGIMFVPRIMFLLFFKKNSIPLSPSLREPSLLEFKKKAVVHNTRRLDKDKKGIYPGGQL